MHTSCSCGAERAPPDDLLGSGVVVRGRWWLLVVLSAGACAFSASAVAGRPSRIEAERSRAQRTLLEIQALDVELGRAAEAWDGARYRLGVLKSRERTVRPLLREARKSARVADARRARLLVAIYESDRPSVVDVLVGARSMTDLIGQLDTEQQLAAAAAKLVRQLVAARARVRRQETELSAEIARQQRLTAQLSARRATIAGELRQRQRLLSSIRGEIAVLKARKEAEERKLARQARIRLAHQLAAARQAARVAAEEQARRAREIRAAQIRAAGVAAQEQARRAAQMRDAARARARARGAGKTPTVAPTPAPPKTTTTAPPAPPDPPTTAPQPPAAPAPPTTAPPPPPPAPAPPTSGNLRVVSIALKYLGVPYRWGGASPQTGFDCSGLVMYVYAQVGISLPHFAAAQYQHGTAVARDQLEPGDLVFFDNLNHVGIYIGNGQFVHAPHTGDVVRISNLDENWFSTHYVGARRIT